MAWWKMCVLKDQGGMGFRDIHCFNLALLAKQAWRLLDNPESLCATILRAKYFPEGDLMNARLKKGSSFTWQSIMAGVNSGELEMDKILIFGEMRGFRIVRIGKLLLLEVGNFCQRWLILLIQSRILGMKIW